MYNLTIEEWEAFKAEAHRRFGHWPKPSLSHEFPQEQVGPFPPAREDGPGRRSLPLARCVVNVSTVRRFEDEETRATPAVQRAMMAALEAMAGVYRLARRSTERQKTTALAIIAARLTHHFGRAMKRDEVIDYATQH